MNLRALIAACVYSVYCALVTACATTARNEGTTWGDDAIEGIASHSPSDGGEDRRPAGTAFALKAKTISALADREQKSLRENSTDLELALIRFTTKRRSLMNHDDTTMQEPGQTAREWPRPMLAAFDNVLEQLELGLDVPKGTVPRRLLIQARVTLEVELESVESKHGRAPQPLVDRVGRLFAGIAVHMRASAPIDDRRVNTHGIALGWPISPVIVTSPFGYRRDPILGRESVRFHAGVDLGGDQGDLVHAAGPGRVVSTGWLGGHGRAVVVQHPGGYQTMYAHLRTILTSIGSEVDLGTPIGSVGSSGRSTGPHLHFEVRHGGAPVDPMEVIEPGAGIGEVNSPAAPYARYRSTLARAGR